MEYRKMGDTFLLRLDPGEEITQSLRRLAEQEQIHLAAVQGLGAVNDFTVGAYDTKKKEYRSNRFQGVYEIVSLSGTIDTMDGGFYAHLHMSAADETGHVLGGHLNRAVISATGELVIRSLEGTLDRAHSPEIGLNLWKF